MKPSTSLEVLALAIRERYIVNRRRFEFVQTGKPSTFGSRADWMVCYDGGRGHRGTMHTNIWIKIAKYFVNAGVDMCQVIDAGFEDSAGGDAPQPSFFLSQIALDRAKEFLPDAVQAARIEFETAQRQASIAYTRYAATRPAHLVWRSVITDPAIASSPLYRFMLARDTGNHDLADKYRAAAVAQFMSRSYVYVQAIPQLPADIVAAASTGGVG